MPARAPVVPRGPRRAKLARTDLAHVEGARRASLPNALEVERATLVDAVPEGDDWLHETKFDGYRMVCFLRDGRARLVSRNGKDWTGSFAAVAQAAERLPARQAVLDGEVVALDARGVSHFQTLQNALAEGDGLFYYVFDLLHLDGWDLRDVPLLKRKAQLEKMLRRAPKGAAAVRYSDHVIGRGARFFAEACRLGLEGVIAKRATSRYRGTRGADWLKIKCHLRQEFVIGGFTDPQKSRVGFGSLLLGVHDGERLVYAGRVGTGFDGRSLIELTRRLRKIEQDESPFDKPLRGVAKRGALHFVKPTLVAEVEFTEWTGDGILRHPSFQGLREDKNPRDVVRELPKDVPESRPGRARRPASGSEANGRASRAEDATLEEGSKQSRTRTAAPPKRPLKNAAPVRRIAVPPRRPGDDVIAGIRITHPDRVIDEASGARKLDVARYYAAVAGRMMPHLGGRPIMAVRCPTGVGGTCFYHKHDARGIPEAVDRIPIVERSGPAIGLAVHDARGVVSLVQMGTLEFHAWMSRQDRPEQPDRMVFDIDPDAGVTWERVIDAARELRERLRELELESFVMTSGGKGLHVTVPLRRRAGWEEVKGFAQAIATSMAGDDPSRYTATMSMAHRKGRIFVDYLRNGRGATAIVPWSTRARARVPIARPLRWQDLESLEAADRTDVATFLAKPIAADPWRDFRAAERSLPAIRKARAS